jgi:hypothetical protein
VRPIFAALVLLTAPALAQERAPIAARVPSGATAYFEVHGLGDRADKLWDSPLADAIRSHPATLKFLESAEGQKFQFAQGMLAGAVGLDIKGLLKEIGKGEIALAVYGKPNNSVLLVEMDPKLANRMVGAVEFASQQPRAEVVPAGDDGPAIFRVGAAFVCIEPALTVVSLNEKLVRRVRAREGEMIANNKNLAEARRAIGSDSLLFGVVDLTPFHAKMAKQGKPKDFGQALFLGAFPHEARVAPWAAVAFDINAEGRQWTIRAEGHVPAPEERDKSVQAAFGGTLEDLPFALPKDTIAVARMRRNLRSLWEYQDDLIAEKALPQLVKFSSTFKTLTGLTFSEELLPRLGADVTVVAVRREWGEADKAPEVRLPHMALIWPIKTDDRMRQSIDLAFQQVMSLIGIQQAEMSRKFMVMRETYKDVPIMTARYPAPAAGEMEGRNALPIRYNFDPAAAVVGDHYILASSGTMLKRLIAGKGGVTKAPDQKNAGLWVRPRPGVAMLADNRDALIAQHMLEHGVNRAEATATIGVLLEALGTLQDFSFTACESKASLGLTFRMVLAAPEPK